MKRIALLIMFLVFGGLSVLQSCNKEVAKEQSVSLRKDFMANKSCIDVKEEYYSLSENERINLWIEKIEQLSQENFSSEYLVLIEDLKNELNSIKVGIVNDENIKNIAISLAQITPTRDFNLMFGYLDDYHYNEKFQNEEIILEFIDELNTLKVDFKHIQDDSYSRSVQYDCNCKWLCDMFSPNSPTTNCNETDWGCGFLWLQNCQKRAN